MSQYFALLPIILYSLIAFQDFRERAISWVLIPLLVITNVAGNIWGQGFPVLFLLKTFVLNLAIIGVQFLLLQAYFSVRNKTFALVTKQLIGWGDLAFYLVLLVTFSPLNLFCFHLASLFICLLAGGITYFSGSIQTIPMAGIQAFLLILLTTASIFSPAVRFFNDDWIVKIIEYVR